MNIDYLVDNYYLYVDKSNFIANKIFSAEYIISARKQLLM